MMNRLLTHLFVAFVSASLVWPAMAVSEAAAAVSAASYRGVNPVERLVVVMSSLFKASTSMIEDCNPQNADEQADKLLTASRKLRKLQDALEQMQTANPEAMEAFRKNEKLKQELFDAVHGFCLAAEKLEKNDYYGSERLRDAVNQFIGEVVEGGGDDESDESPDDVSDEEVDEEAPDATAKAKIIMEQMCIVLADLAQSMAECDEDNADAQAAVIEKQFRLLEALREAMRKQGQQLVVEVLDDEDLMRRLMKAFALCRKKMSELREQNYYHSSPLRRVIEKYEDELPQTETTDASESHEGENSGMRSAILDVVDKLEQVTKILEACNSANAEEKAEELLKLEESMEGEEPLENILQILAGKKRGHPKAGAVLQEDEALKQRLDAVMERYYAALKRVTAADCYQSSRLKTAILRLFL